MELNSFIENRKNFLDAVKLLSKNTSSLSLLLLSEDFLLAKEYCEKFCEILVKDKDKVKLNVHPDVKIYGLTGESFLTENAKNLIEQMTLKPLEADKKVFVIYNAEKLSAEVQNKLLKTLEEPLDNNFIIFVASSEENLLATVKSRLSKIEIQKLSQKEFCEILKISKDNEKLYFKVDGNLTLAKKYLNEQNFKQNYENAINIIEKMQKSSEIINFRNLFKKENIIEMFSIFKLIFKILLDDEKNKFVFSENTISDYSKIVCIGAVEVLNKAINKQRANCNLAPVVDCFLIELLEVKYKWKNY